MSSIPRVRIVLNMLISLVVRREKISLSEASKMLDLDESSLNAIVHILVEKKILSIEYTADGERIIGKGEAVEGTDYMEIKMRVDEILSSIKEEDLEAARKAEEEQEKRIHKTRGQDE
jgi:hypothetical protein